jgi:hypothetical protein
MRACLIKAAPVAAALGLLGCVANAGQADQSEEPLRCEIAATSAGKTITLEGVAEADGAVSGSYRFRVVSSGRGGASDVHQAGAFAAGPHSPVMLSRVMLSGGSGTVFEATLTIEVDGETIECSERFGGT